MNVVLVLLGLLVIAGAAVLIGVAVFQRTMVYRFAETDLADVTLPEGFVLREIGSGGDAVPVILSDPGPGAPFLIAFGGNFSGADDMASHMAPFAKAGLGVVIPVYPGAHQRAGRTTEGRIFRDAVTVYDGLDELLGFELPQDARYSYGFSLGASPAVSLAADRPSAGVILEAGFDRLCRFQERRLKGAPMCRLMWAERHDVIDRIGAIDAPVLMAHGAQDRSIDIAWARALADAAPTSPAFETFPDAGHLDLLDHGLVDRVLDFVGAR